MLMLGSKLKGLRTLKDIKPALDVCIDIRIGRVVRVWNRDQGGEVIDHEASLNSLLDAVGIADVIGEDFQVLFDVIVTVVQPAPRVKGVVKNEDTNVMPRPYEGLCQMGTNESISSGHKYLLTVERYQVLIKYWKGIPGRKIFVI